MTGPSRRDRAGCFYYSYIPDPLKGRRFVLEGSTAAELSDAETAVVRLNKRPSKIGHAEPLGRLLLRAESVASSRIEGIAVGPRRLLRAEAARAAGDDPRDETAEEILANIDAMVMAIDDAGRKSELNLDDILRIHARLMKGTRLERFGGQLRQQQNWLGGSGFNPCNAAYVPPPPEKVEALMHDLCAFCNEESLPPVAQAAIAHSQFETIHPFVDGNGRTGRALIHLILRRRGLVTTLPPPISIVLATWSGDYIGGLVATRYEGKPGSAKAREGLDQWVAFFAGATARAALHAVKYEQELQLLGMKWRERLGRVRRGSAADLLLNVLPGVPVLTVNSASRLIDMSFPAANSAVARLVDAGILKPLRIGRRNRAFEAPEIIQSLSDLERRLSTP